ncbi:hypothetical protein C8Q75DRAFT_550082 [Abortiporus biennis]|nr:hypothetical protein C8Q75DRAFT_550082 [Abortiporus biennis]
MMKHLHLRNIVQAKLLHPLLAVLKLLLSRPHRLLFNLRPQFMLSQPLRLLYLSLPQLLAPVLRTAQLLLLLPVLKAPPYLLVAALGHQDVVVPLNKLRMLMRLEQSLDVITVAFHVNILALLLLQLKFMRPVILQVAHNLLVLFLAFPSSFSFLGSLDLHADIIIILYGVVS